MNLPADSNSAHILLYGLGEIGVAGVNEYFTTHSQRRLLYSKAGWMIPADDLLGPTAGILCGAGQLHERKTRFPAYGSLPIVTFGRSKEPVPYAEPDYRSAGTMAARHFLHLGLRTLAFIGLQEHMSEDMRAGFVATAEQAGATIYLNEDNIFSALSKGSPEEERFHRWLQDLPKPCGLLCPLSHPTSFIALLCERDGIEIPEEIALLSGNHEPLVCMLARPPISMMVQNYWQMGYEAARLMDRILSGEQIPSDTGVLVPTVSIDQQASTNILALGNPRLEKAVRYIREHACKGITAADVVQTVSTSRRTLEMQIKNTLGRSIHEEITRVRLDHAKELLASSNLSMSEIALRCGIEWASSFCTLFAKHVGQTPGAYRKTLRARMRGETDTEANL